MFVKLVALFGLLAFLIGAAARPSGGAGRSRTYVVKPTDTLWSIASRSYAGDVREGVWKLQQRNHLPSATIRPGERLILPAG